VWSNQELNIQAFFTLHLSGLTASKRGSWEINQLLVVSSLLLVSIVPCRLKLWGYLAMEIHISKGFTKLWIQCYSQIIIQAAFHNTKYLFGE